jgi:predicted PurR-regulated permease PerM
VISDPRDTENRDDHEHVGRISTPTILFVLAAATIAVYELQLVLLPFVLAGVVSYVCTPGIDFVSRRLRLPRLAVAVLTFLLILAAVAGIALLGIPPLVQEIRHMATDLQGTATTFAQKTIGGGKIDLLGQQMDAQQLADKITGAARNWFGNAKVIAILGGSVIVSTFGFFLTLVVFFFFLVSGPRIVRGLLWLVPPGQRHLIADHILSNLDPILRRYFIGVLGIVIFASVFAYVGLGLVLGVPHALFLALVTGILEAIPIVGPTIAAAIAGLVALQHNFGVGAIVGYAAYLAALRLSIDQFFGPVILGAAGRVHPVLVIFSFLAGGSLFGIIGVILAVPTALIIRATLAVLYDEPLRSARAPNKTGTKSG